MTHPLSSDLHDETQKTLLTVNAVGMADAETRRAAILAERNRQVEEDYFGLLPQYVHWMNNYPFEIPDVAEFQSSVTGISESCPLAKYFSLLVKEIGPDGVKPTVTGNLPRNLVRSVARQAMTPEHYAERTRFRNIQTESHIFEITIVRHLAQLAGFLRKVNGKFTVTKTCQKSIATKGLAAVYPKLFRMYAERYNWGYRSYDDDFSYVQDSFLFSVYMLHRFGDEFRPSSFYEDAYLQAFPSILDGVEGTSYCSAENRFRRYYRNRCLSDFMSFTGVAEWDTQETETLYGRSSTCLIRKTDLLEKIVKFNV